MAPDEPETTAEETVRLRSVLADIASKGHTGGFHGRGYHLATIALNAIDPGKLTPAMTQRLKENFKC